MMLFKSYFVFVVVFLAFTFLLLPYPRSVYAQTYDTIRVSGFGLGRTRFVLADDNGGFPPNFYFPVMSQLYVSLNSDALFGQNGIVACDVERLDDLTDYVVEGSLINNDGELLYDVFFGPPISTELSPEEASELARFVKGGGVLYVSGRAFVEDTPELGYSYNPLFEELNIQDRFENELVTVPGLLQSYYPLDSIITKGSFGDIGYINDYVHVYSKFNENFLRGTIGVQDGDFLFLERNIESGYLIVSSSALFTNLPIRSDDDINNYFLNLFALGCGEQDFGKYDKVAHLNKDCCRMTMIPQFGKVSNTIMHILKTLGVVRAWHNAVAHSHLLQWS